MKRTGDCFTKAANYVLSRSSSGLVHLLVHGMPTGKGGDAAKAGKYPHAWVEIPEFSMVIDVVSDVAMSKEAYYALGKISGTFTYSIDQLRKIAVEKGTYGPWEKELLDRDAEIDNLIKDSERVGLLNVE